jgi:hypothetical protein
MRSLALRTGVALAALADGLPVGKGKEYELVF